MSSDKIEAARAAKRNGPAFLEYGFRPFFLGAGIQAVLAMGGWIMWIFLLRAKAMPDSLTVAVPVHVWHAHEMIFGYGLAVVAGFFLTAVPSWTGKKPVRGTMLGMLFALWLAARLASWFSASLPPVAVALPELAFIAMLSALVGHALLSGWSRRNFLFLPVLVAMFAATVLYHLKFPYPAHILGLDTLLVLFTVIGGRVIPAFTTNTMRRDGVEPLPRASGKRDIAAILSVVGLAIADLALPGSKTAGAVAIVAGLLVACRMIGWRTPKVLNSPILWILHLGYAWLAFGLTFKGVAIITGAVPEITAVHALTIGAIGSMTMGVMSRAALGHTGRELKVTTAIASAYLLVSLAAIIRISSAALPARLHDEAVLASGTVWITAFLIFAVTYWPVLTRSRVSIGRDEQG
jgi:uncharacterized protein involved in response to NO